MPQGIGQCLSSQRLSFYIWKEGRDFLNFFLVRNRFQQDWHGIPVHKSYIQYSLSGHGIPWAPLQVFIVLRTLALMPPSTPCFTFLSGRWDLGTMNLIAYHTQCPQALKTEHARPRTFHL